ncbi:MAG: type II secretion system F family protein [Peptococcaceae bacterium]|nr:type II secretion system F family protein [Peptococcaceae bacterium]
MPTYAYKVRDQGGKALSGSLEADNQKQVVDRLRESGYFITSLKEKDLLTMDINITFGTGVTLKDVAIFSRQFAIMIQSGIALLRCLDILYAQQENKNLKRILGQIKKAVEEGSSLSQAFAQHPKVFPPLFINMIHAGEVGGVMDEALDRLAEHFDKEHELREKIKGASTYPVTVFVFAIIIVNVLLIFVVPQFAAMFSSFTSAQLPLLTRMMLGLSNFLKHDALFLLIATILLLYGFNRYRKSPTGKSRIDYLVLKLPVFGPMVLKLGVARFTRTLGTLVKSGVPILLALEVTENTAGNAVIAKGIAAARQSIKDGESISGPLTASGVFPPMVTQMIAVGEESGAIETMLSRIADFYDREVKIMVDSLTSLIEPFLIIFLAVVVGGIVASIMLPMFSLYGQIH